MIIWLASYPRSGNTLCRTVLKQVFGLDSYSIYDESFFVARGLDSTVGHKSSNLTFEEMTSSEAVFFVKTHDLPTDNQPAIYIVRDGRDALISYAHQINTLHSSKRAELSKILKYGLLKKNHYERILKDLIIPSNRYRNWSKNVSQWSNRGGLVLIVKFEDLIEDPVVSIRSALEELQLCISINEFCPETLEFGSLNQKWPDFFRKGKSRCWRSEMSEDLQNLFWQYHAHEAEQLGYVQSE